MSRDRKMPAPNEWECLLFIALAQHHTPTKAADALKRQGRPCVRQSVERARQRMEAWYGEELFDRGPGGLHLNRHGEHVVEAARNIVAEYRLLRADEPDAGKPPLLACHPHHARFVSMAMEALRDHERLPTGMRVEYLTRRNRGVSRFHEHAVTRLEHGAYDAIIGPEVDNPSFSTFRLYYAHLEAMVLADDRRSTMPLTDLLRTHRVLLPHPDMRARVYFEDTVRDLGIDDPQHDVRVAAETYDTASAIVTVRSEYTSAGRLGTIVVASSDAALPFKPGMEFGGEGAELFKWIPIVHSPARGNLVALRHSVHLTWRRGPEEWQRVSAIRDALRRAVDEIEAAPEPQLRLSGSRIPEDHDDHDVEVPQQRNRP